MVKTSFIPNELREATDPHLLRFSPPVYSQPAGLESGTENTTKRPRERRGGEEKETHSHGLCWKERLNFSSCGKNLRKRVYKASSTWLKLGNGSWKASEEI